MEAAQLERSGILVRASSAELKKGELVYKQYVQENKTFGESYGRAHMSAKCICNSSEYLLHNTSNSRQCILIVPVSKV